MTQYDLFRALALMNGWKTGLGKGMGKGET